jgi:hypothetical protein
MLPFFEQQKETTVQNHHYIPYIYNFTDLYILRENVSIFFLFLLAIPTVILLSVTADD